MGIRVAVGLLDILYLLANQTLKLLKTLWDI